MTPTVSPAVAAAYRMFSTWRRDALNAGFIARGSPLVAYRALDAIVMGVSDRADMALRRAEAALVEWSESHETVRETCAPVLAIVREELTAMRQSEGRA